MKSRNGFAFIALLIVLVIIGLSFLIGLKFYGFNQRGSSESSIVENKAKDTIVQANSLSVYNLLQGAVIAEDVSLDDAVKLSQVAGLHDPFTEIAMDKTEWFPEIADSPGQVQIILKENIFYIQGYGSNGLLNEVFTVEK